MVTPGTLPQQAASGGVADDPQPERVHGVLSFIEARKPWLPVTGASWTEFILSS
jgi:hypothetical protein